MGNVKAMGGKALVVLLLIGFGAIFLDRPDNIRQRMERLDTATIPYMDLAAWINLAMNQAFTFQNAAHRDQLIENSRMFNEAGYTQYIALLQQTQILEYLPQQGVTVRMRNATFPLLVRRGPVDGAFQWTVTTDVDVIVVLGQTEAVLPLNLRVTIRRIEPTEQNGGLVITEMQAIEAPADS